MGSTGQFAGCRGAGEHTSEARKKVPEGDEKGFTPAGES